MPGGPRCVGPKVCKPRLEKLAAASLCFSGGFLRCFHAFWLPFKRCACLYLCQPLPNMGGPLQPQSAVPLQPAQQGAASQSAGAKASLPSTWSDHKVDISLDFLGPGMQPPKPMQPTLNTLQQGERSRRAVARALPATLLQFTIWHFH